MSFLKHISGKDHHPGHPATTVQALLEQYGGTSLDRQHNLYDVIGEHNWDADLDAGTISFGEGKVFPLQVLGTFSHSAQTWLWAWANVQSAIPPAVLEQALQLKAYGVQHNIDLFTRPDFEAEENDLHRIGMIAAGIFDTSAYYLADYGQGILLATINGEQIDLAERNNLARPLSVFPQLISFFEMNHKNAFSNYLSQIGYTIAEQPDTLTATWNGHTITASFDEQSRLTQLNGSNSPIA